MRLKKRNQIKTNTFLRGRARNQLLAEFIKAKQTITRLTAEENKLKHIKEMLVKITYDLGERVKELNCLYSISNIVENQSNSLEDILQGVVNIIPRAWQYPEITCSRIVLIDRIVSTGNFTEKPWKQSQPIVVRGCGIGSLEICYLEERPEKEDGPFLKEERSLINVLAERIGEIIERREAQEALQESEAHNKALLGAIPDLMFQINSAGKLLGFHEGKFTEIKAILKELTGKNIFVLADVKKILPRRILEQAMSHARLALATGRTQIFEQHINLDGAERDFEIRIVNLRDYEVLGIVQDITSRKRLEKEIIEISGREQRRIGQDLHDSLCQQLTGIGFLCKALETRIAEKLPVKASEVGEVVQHIDEAITLTRGYARGLNPVRLEANGLIYALSELALTTEKIFGISCRFDYNETSLIEDNDTAMHLYRIAQEALNNAIKHGRATRVAISLSRAGKNQTLSVKDNGTGFSGTAQQGKGMGLSIMKYRASMIGASVEIKNHEDGGAAVLCSFQTINDTY